MPGLPLQRVDALGQEGKLRLGSVMCHAPGTRGEAGVALSCRSCLLLVLGRGEATNGLGRQRAIR